MSTIPDWLPGVERVQGSDAGPMLPGSKWSLLLHTTEGGSLQGAIAALRAKSAWSHFIYDPATEQLVQAVSMNRAAKSLRSGGNLGKTNAARVIQVEIVGRAADTDHAPQWWNESIGRMIARIGASVPFRIEMPLPFYGDESGFTVASQTAKQRMSWAAWYRFDAICGHQHAPRNDHWDPGAINAAAILAAARKHAPKWTPLPFPGTITKTSSKERVAVWRMVLGDLGYRGFKVGLYPWSGVLSLATKRLQRRHGLVADGIVGPKTWAVAMLLLTQAKA